MEFLLDYGLFLAKTATLVVALGLIIGLLASAGMRNRREPEGHIELISLNDRFSQWEHQFQEALMEEAELKALIKEEKKTEKAKQKAAKRGENVVKKRVYVLDFDGDIKASAVENMRNEISALLTFASKEDEVFLRLESGGGMVHSYGLAASQLQRIRERGIPLTVAVDRVAASGGYMMACIAQNLIAAPFAIIGSVGVVAQLPNFHRLLKKNDIDVELHTAGSHKRTLTLFGENTDEDRERFREELEDTHVLFKEFVSEQRPAVDVDLIATGETWYGKRALEKSLVDKVQTSDDYLLEKSKDSDLFLVKYVHRKSLPEKLGLAAEQSVERVFLKLWDSGRQFMR